MRSVGHVHVFVKDADGTPGATREREAVHAFFEAGTGRRLRHARRGARRAWVEPQIFDVFAHDGRYLGAVRFPERTTPYVFRGDNIWGVQRGALDEQYVVRFRLAQGAARGRAPD